MGVPCNVNVHNVIKGKEDEISEEQEKSLKQQSEMGEHKNPENKFSLWFPRDFILFLLFAYNYVDEISK